MTEDFIVTYVAGSQHWVGDGFPVRNFLPSNNINLSPFLMLDYAGPAYFEPSLTPKGVGEHPHRGFETVTIAYQGSVEHRDSAGNRGIIYPGDVQWMTAGSGVVHEEMHEAEFSKSGGQFEMIQLWVNLPQAFKMTTPRYQALQASGIPTLKLDDCGSFARIIAGEFLGQIGPALTFSALSVVDLKLGKVAKIEMPLNLAFNNGFFLLSGELEIEGQKGFLSGPQIGIVRKSRPSLTLRARSESRLLLLAGQPINEPVASYGPFVMNSREELIQAVSDYETGKMGHLS